MSQTGLQYHRDLREFEQDFRELSYAVDGGITALQNEVNDLRRIQTIYSTRDDVSTVNNRLTAIELVLEGLSEVIASELAKKIKECFASLPEVISKEDFMQALDEFIFQ